VSAYQSCVGFLNDPMKGNIADAVLADFNNGEAKKLVARMKAIKPRLSNKTIVTYFQTVQSVIASAEKNDGDKMYPRDWNLVFIGLPKIDAKKQNKPAFSADEIETIMSKARSHYPTFYALLAGSGLRVGEAVGLRIEHLLDNCTRLVVAQSVWGGKEQSPKTASAYREVDICEELAFLLHKHIGDRTSGFVFQTRNGKPISPHNIERDSLRPNPRRNGVEEIRETIPLVSPLSFRKFSERTACRGSLKNFGLATPQEIFQTATPKDSATIWCGVNRLHSRLDWDFPFLLGNWGNFWLKKICYQLVRNPLKRFDFGWCARGDSNSRPSGS
jgi:integrase